MTQNGVPSTTNPWVAQQAAQPTRRTGPEASYQRTGPARPVHLGVRAPDGGGLPLWTPRTLPHAAWWWVGCHGGAGTTALYQTVPGGLECGCCWPVPEVGPAPKVVLVTRTHVRGLRATQEAARQWASGQAGSVELLGLVAVADAPGRLPKKLRASLRFVSGGVPRMWQVPWVEAWRTVEPSASGPRVSETVKLAADLARLTAESRTRP